MSEAVTSALIGVGVFFLFVASLGVLRLSDFYTRIHAPTKGATLGLSSLLLAFAVAVPETTAITKALLVLGLIAATVPVGSHILMRAAYRSNVPRARETKLDEYHEELERRRGRREEPPESTDVLEEQQPERRL
ncbi:MAG TPA: Na+/H+ antiporter subunit G [Myxococcales bacterium]|nr:Na+/H+ antiporter subunit G [Myxococcales bacterium]